MCEQAARYCRDGVHKLLQKEQPKLRAQDSKEQPKPVDQDSESATAAQSGNSGAQPGAIDGLVRWIVTKMSDNKSISTREYAKEEASVAQEQFFAPEPRKGISVILDIFRRADKDDDGKLSLDEFQAFFSDGTLNEEELENLFHSIDSDNTRAMDFTKKVYERGTNVEQFVTRFLLKESANQIQSLLNSVESAVDCMCLLYLLCSSVTIPLSLMPLSLYLSVSHPSLSIVRTAKDVAPRNINTATGVVEVRKETLEAQINRLAELIGRLENKTVWFDLHQRLTDTDGTASASLYLIRQEMAVSQKQLGEFCEALKQYLKNVSAQRDCFHVTAVRLPDGLSFVVYEFWDGEEEWKKHLQTASSKAFQHVKVDTLCQPEAVSTVAVISYCSIHKSETLDLV
uniref:N-terminal EF-hand calcium binding protein 2 n=1 Tax=Oncorhynchus kisutch TaxID=8019 RepID=A0A8C7DDS4_ONCKI